MTLNNSYNELIKGNFDDVPPSIPSEIRIFLSSTFKDYQPERNYIIENIYDDLRKKCLEKYQKDLIFIDMRFGITDEAANQQITTQICLNEIEKCQKESIGPSFVAFLSHRYGSRILQLNIEMEEFQLIKSEIKNNKEIIDLLEYCYELDENGVKSKEYKLKRVDHILQGLNIDRKTWRVKEDLIVNSIRKAADTCLKKGKFTKAQWNPFFTSVTDQEIQMGILNEKYANLKTAVFFRDIHGLNPNADGFSESDTETKILLNELKIEVRKKLALTNKHYFEVDWNNANCFKEPYSDEMSLYLKKFGDCFQTSLLKLIDENAKNIPETSTVDSEILHHARFCNILARKFTSRPYLVDKINAYLEDDSNRPFIVAASSGAGKSCLMAFIAKEVKSKHANITTIVRFMGTSRESSSMKSIMKSLINQLSTIFNENIKNEEFESVIDLRDRLMKLLNIIHEKHPEEKIVIILDSIDQLTKQDYNLDWIFYDLPKNVKIIYSVIKDYEEIYDRLKLKLKGNSLEIEKLTIDEARNILKVMLSSIDRQLTSAQWENISTLFTLTKEIYPLHVKLIFDITSKWVSSYAPSDDFYCCITIKDTVKYLFKKLEMLYGEVLFSSCVFYLTLLEYKGISELELQDVLSIDDDVLTAVFQYHHPPVRKFPLALWMNIKYELKEYITNKETDGISVVSWFHRSFIEASYEYYNSLFEPSEYKDKILMNIIDYFIEKWHPTRSDGTQGLMKDFIFERKGKKLTNFALTSDGRKYLTYRNTKSQKIRRLEKDGQRFEYNKRKLNELVNIINMLSNVNLKIELLKEHVYFNYEFMLSKAELQNMNFVVDMHENLLKLKSKDDLNTIEFNELIDISEIYVNCYPKIEQDPKLYLSTEVLSRLNSRSNYVKSFAAPTNLILLNSYIQNDTVRDLYLVDSTLRINQLFSFNEFPFVFIETFAKKNPLSTCLTLIHTSTKSKIGRLNFSLKADKIRIFCENSIDSMKNVKVLNDLNGFIYFTAKNGIYSMDFNNEESKLIQFDDNIENIFILNTNCILVQFQNCCKLVNIRQEEVVVIEEIPIEHQIEFLITTLTPDIVYFSELLGKVAFVTIIIGYRNQTFKIFKFSNDEPKLNLICDIKDIGWNNDEGITPYWDELKDFVIDQDYLIENFNWNNEDSLLLRCAVEKKGIIKIIEIKHNGIYIVVDEINNMNDINEVNRGDFITGYEPIIKTVSFYKNRIISCLAVDSQKSNVYIYDLNKKSQLKMNKIVNVKMEYLISSNYLIVKNVTRFVIYEIYDNEIKKRMEIKVDFKNYKNTIIKKSDKLIMIETRHLFVKELDTSIRKRELPKSKLKVLKIVSEIDTTHVLAETESQDLRKQVVIIDIISQTILKSLAMHKRTRVMAFKMPYFVLSFCKREGENIIDTSDQFIFMYKIESDFEFIQILKKPISYTFSISNSAPNLIYDFDNGNKFFYPIYNTDKDEIEIRILEAMPFDYRYEVINLDIKQFEFKERRLRIRFTSLDKYLVLYDDMTNVIYILNIYTKSIVDKIVADSTLADVIYFNVAYVPTTNDLIFKEHNTLYYMKFNAVTMKYDKILAKNYTNHRFEILWKNDFFIIASSNDEIIEFFKLNDILKQPVLSKIEPLIIKERLSSDDFTISNNSKYFIILTKFTSKKFIIYKLEDNGFNQITSFRLPDRIESLRASENYITARIWRYDYEQNFEEYFIDENQTLLIFELLK